MKRCYGLLAAWKGELARLDAAADLAALEAAERRAADAWLVEGRQISEGCLIPAIGGGICQLSNALYEVALGAKLTIVERHPHTRIVPGSASEWGKDATVFWNYLDLRFVSPVPLLLTYLLRNRLSEVAVLATPARKAAKKSA